MIRVQNLHKTFRVHKKAPGLWNSVKSLFHREWIIKSALENVSLSLDEGEIVGLIGSNGAGKTTMVKIMAGIIGHDEGMVRVAGFDPWRRDNEFRRQIALIMGQKAQLWWDLPAADSFLLLREIYRIPSDIFRKRMTELVDTLGVGHVMDIQLRRLSLGERMKMELIAALLHAPRIVFLDEPTIGLDLSAQRAIRDFLLEYRQRHNPAMIITSHYMEDIERLCPRIVILRSGKVVYDGALRKILTDYARHKNITVRVAALDTAEDTEASADDDRLLLPAALNDDARRSLEEFIAPGRLVRSERGELKVQSPRADIPRVTARLLERFQVRDINIEEEEIGTIIESIMRARPTET